ncbi:MAG: EscJ/YscJ/HrcJ family type III secretion inner membrane ring protein [Limnobacter sp.]|uniref:type III secretion system inner membrane ring lipoprotein SctJ n=1 Tax=Limnobacter sp. TaxID=2003368 RepID=UPI001202B969|nr:type III secretion inner membrane ring lipoprotein SctJ [Limnobacter sp.]RZO93760.1 MAG: EscJ/YscJ/HrcJ family type III secretion inner membrane ring protein [Limnobacter sp.]
MRFNLIKLLVMIMAAVTLQACGSRIALFQDLNEADANEIYAVLLDSGIPAQKEQGKNGISISVPQRMSGDALLVLKARGLPKSKRGTIGEIFKKDSMISSPLEEKARYLFALSQELEQTLLTIDGVISARVHLVLPERPAPGEQLIPSSVAVFVKHKTDSPFQAYISKIRELVSSSIPGVGGGNAERISIVAIPSNEYLEKGLPLIWYGPMALMPEDRVAFLMVIYTLIGLWLLSMGAVYLSVADQKNWPKFLHVFKRGSVDD